MKNSIFLSILTPVRSYRLNTKLGENKRIIYFVSTGRTGTKFFADYFGKLTDVYAIHEPKPSRILRMWTNARFEERATKNKMSQVFISKRKSILRKITEPIYVESNPFIVGFTDIIPEVINNTEIIHIVRDPRTYIRSSLNHGNTHGIKKLLNNHLPYWYPNISKIVDTKQKFTEKEKVAHYWVLINQFLEDSKKSIPKKNYHIFKYEDIFSNGNSIEQISQIIGSKDKQVNSVKKVNKSKDNVVPQWDSWTKQECKSIDSICGELMKKYGYGDEKAWLEKLK